MTARLPLDQNGPRLQLYGYPVSNYFNAVRAALIEKGADFAWVPTRASQDEAFLAKSVMGKIPYLETDQGCIAETVAILEFIEDTVAGVALYPVDAFEKARVRQIINIVQVYVEAPLRSLFPGVFMGGANSPAAIAAARSTLDRALGALRQFGIPASYLAGDQISYADLFAFYTFDVGDRVSRFTWNRSLIDEIDGWRTWYDTMSQRPSTQATLADFSTAFAAYLHDKAAAWREPEQEETYHA